MNNLKRNSNYLAALLAFAHIIVGGVTSVLNSIKTFEAYKVVDEYDPMAIEMQERLPSTIIGALIQYVPVLLFVIYSLFLYRKKKNHPLLMGSFAFSTALTLWSFVSVILSSVAMSRYLGYSNSPYTQESMFEQYLPQMIVYAVMLVVYIFFLINSAKGFKLVNASKVLSLIMAIALLAKPIISLVTSEKFRDRTVGAQIEAAVEEIAASDVFITFLIPLLLALSFIVFWWVTVPNSETKLSKSELENLRRKFESGKIDEQTYQRKRAEIIEKI